MAVLPYGKQLNIINWRGDDIPWNMDLGLLNVGQGQYLGGWTKFPFGRAVMSLCAPGRAAGFTGRFPNKHRVFGNSDGADFDFTKTYFVDLARRGYTNFCGGKLMNGYGEPGGNSGAFEIAASFPSIGMHKVKWIYGSPSYGLGDPGDGNRFIDENKTITGDEETDVGDAFYYPDLWEEHVLAFLAGVPVGRPWSIYIGDKASHQTVTAATRYQNTAISWTDDPGFGVDPSGGVTKQPPWLIDEAVSGWGGGDANDARTLQKERLRSLRASDDSLKAVIDAVVARGELERTLIIISGDQTDYSGQLQVDGGKGSNHWGCNQLCMSIRAPVASGSPNQVCYAPVMDPDIASTIRHVCGATASEMEDGMSMQPLLVTPTLPFREAIPYFNKHKPPAMWGLTNAGGVTYGKGVSGEETDGQEWKWTDFYNTRNEGYDPVLSAEVQAMLEANGI